MLYKNTLLLQHQLHFPVGINDGEDEVFKTAAIYFSNRIVCTEIPLVAYRKTPGSLSRRKKDGIQKFLPYINGRLELAKVYHIDDEIWIDTQEEVCCWLMKELAVWHFKYGGRRDILEPVSYTHLDVYKRQITKGRAENECRADAAGEEFQWKTPPFRRGLRRLIC